MARCDPRIGGGARANSDNWYRTSEPERETEVPDSASRPWRSARSRGRRAYRGYSGPQKSTQGHDRPRRAAGLDLATADDTGTASADNLTNLKTGLTIPAVPRPAPGWNCSTAPPASAPRPPPRPQAPSASTSRSPPARTTSRRSPLHGRQCQHAGDSAADHRRRCRGRCRHAGARPQQRRRWRPVADRQHHQQHHRADDQRNHRTRCRGRAVQRHDQPRHHHCGHDRPVYARYRADRGTTFSPQR